MTGETLRKNVGRRSRQQEDDIIKAIVLIYFSLEECLMCASGQCLFFGWKNGCKTQETQENTQFIICQTTASCFHINVNARSQRASFSPRRLL